MTMDSIGFDRLFNLGFAAAVAWYLLTRLDRSLNELKKALDELSNVIQQLPEVRKRVRDE